MKYLILVGDGMGDHPIPDLGNITPLQAARTPAMDGLCQRGTLLAAATIPDGFPPGSDVANMSLLGYAPERYYTGRAPLEAASMGIELTADETAFRCNLVTLEYIENDRATMLDFSAGHINNEEAAELIAALQAECGSDSFHFHAGISYRHLLVVKDSLAEVITVPPHDFIDQDVTTPLQAYLKSPAWRSLILRTRAILAQHPVNLRRVAEGKRPATGIWPWGKGKMPSIPSLHSRFGITGTMISAVDLLKGLGICCGLSIAHVEGATGYIDTNYAGKAKAAIDALENQDFVFVHLEGPDEAGHQARLDHKIQAIEDFDAKIVAPIITTLGDRGIEFRTLVTMDHFTPLALRTHTAEIVPAILYDSREKVPGSGLVFNETAIQNPNHVPRVIPGCRLLEKLLQQTGMNI